MSVHCETFVGPGKVGGAVGGDVQADIENAVVRWDKFDSVESYGDHGAVGGFDSSTKGKSDVVPWNLRTPRALPLGAPRSKYRRKILPMYKQKKESKVETLRLTKKEKSEKSRWVLWIELMRWVFSEDISSCVNCGGRMELRAVVIRPPATITILDGLVGSMCGRDPPDVGLD